MNWQGVDFNVGLADSKILDFRGTSTVHSMQTKGPSALIFHLYFGLRHQGHYSFYPLSCHGGRTISSDISGHPLIIHREGMMHHWRHGREESQGSLTRFWHSLQAPDPKSRLLYNACVHPRSKIALTKIQLLQHTTPCFQGFQLCLRVSCMSTTKISSKH